ncbi:transposase [Catalinimonas sp. 4WD22]|uniref:transposase n=1 Tax=Catalinimonas locisalis TaxID=3133978 RepID=UPI003100BC88
MNGRKRHVLTDTLGLVWGGVVHAANQADGTTAERVVAPLQGYLHRMKRILADAAYKHTFMDWVYANLLGVEWKYPPVPYPKRLRAYSLEMGYGTHVWYD